MTMAWYQDRTCAVCTKTIGKRHFWQDKPRLVDSRGDARDAGYIADDRADALLATHVLVCPACYFNRFGDVKALAVRQGAPVG